MYTPHLVGQLLRDQSQRFLTVFLLQQECYDMPDHDVQYLDWQEIPRKISSSDLVHM